MSRVVFSETAVMLALGLSGVAYVVGLERTTRRRRADPVRVAAMVAALVFAAAALLGPLEAASHRWFSAHMAQHLLVAFVVAPLLVVARSGTIMLAAFPGGRRGPLARTRHRIARTVGAHQVEVVAGTTIVLLAVLTFWHVPAMHGPALRSDALHAVQHVSLLVAAVAFWSAVLRLRSGTARLAALLALFAVLVHGGLLGAWLTFAPRVVYPGYPIGDPDAAMADQSLAGLLMWVPGGLFPLGFALFVLGSALGRRGGRPGARARRRSRIRRVPTSVALAVVILAVSACDAGGGVDVGIGDADAGREAIERYGCASCHLVPGMRGSAGRVGPSLAGIDDRVYIAGRLEAGPETVALFISDPKTMVPGTAMPDLRVSDEEARDITQYLYEHG